MTHLFKNISNLVTCANPEGGPKRGNTQGDIYNVKNGFLLFDKKILFAGNESGCRKFIKEHRI